MDITESSGDPKADVCVLALVETTEIDASKVAFRGGVVIDLGPG